MAFLLWGFICELHNTYIDVGIAGNQVPDRCNIGFVTGHVQGSRPILIFGIHLNNWFGLLGKQKNQLPLIVFFIFQHLRKTQKPGLNPALVEYYTFF